MSANSSATCFHKFIHTNSFDLFIFYCLLKFNWFNSINLRPFSKIQFNFGDFIMWLTEILLQYVEKYIDDDRNSIKLCMWGRTVQLTTTKIWLSKELKIYRISHSVEWCTLHTRKFVRRVWNFMVKCISRERVRERVSRNSSDLLLVYKR